MIPSLVHPTSLLTTVSRLRSGELELGSWIEEVCDRIEAVDPVVRALLPEPGRRERLLREAAALAGRYPDPGSRPPLYGALVGVKDIFRVDGFETRAGSTLPPELFAGAEASSVTRLREAGALVLGKAVTTEFAYFEPGPTRNPWSPEHTPGGSSSGSAAAVAAGFCPLALGSQTVGSVIRPAAFCGVAGFKPTYGRIPIDGVLPFAPPLDHVGFFTADAASLELAASLLCEGWRGTGPAAGSRPRLGIPEGPYLAQASVEALEAFEAWAARLAEAGFEVVRCPALEDLEEVRARNGTLTAAGMAGTHAAWFDRYREQYRPRTAALIEEGRRIPPERLEAALRGQAALREELLSRMDGCRITAWICPAATGTAPEGLGSTGDPSMNMPWSHAGMPAATLPAGRAGNGLPLGLQLVGRPGEDEALLALARGVEAALGERSRAA